jgi:hypothetical protein
MCVLVKPNAVGLVQRGQVWVQATARVRRRGRVVAVTNYRHKDATPHVPAACSCSFYTSGRLGGVCEAMAVLRGGFSFRLVLLGLPSSPNKPIPLAGLIGAYTHWRTFLPSEAIICWGLLNNVFMSPGRGWERNGI